MLAEGYRKHVSRKMQWHQKLLFCHTVCSAASWERFLRHLQSKNRFLNLITTKLMRWFPRTLTSLFFTMNHEIQWCECRCSIILICQTSSTKLSIISRKPENVPTSENHIWHEDHHTNTKPTKSYTALILSELARESNVNVSIKSSRTPSPSSNRFLLLPRIRPRIISLSNHGMYVVLLFGSCWVR